MIDEQLHDGQRVRKIGGDYSVVGTVAARFTKSSGAVRAVVECDEPKGLLLIFNAQQLEPLPCEVQP